MAAEADVNLNHSTQQTYEESSSVKHKWLLATQTSTVPSQGGDLPPHSFVSDRDTLQVFMGSLGFSPAVLPVGKSSGYR